MPVRSEPRPPARRCTEKGEVEKQSLPAEPTMRPAALLLCLTLLRCAGAGFPEDSEPISISHGNYTKQYPVFVGHKPGRNATQRHRLDIQMIMIMNRTSTLLLETIFILLI